MKRIVYLSFNAENRSWDEISLIFVDAQLDSLLKKGASSINFYSIKLEEGSSKLNLLRNNLREKGIEWSERMEISYSFEEKRKYDMFWLCVNSAPIGSGGATYGTEYDLTSSCTNCGTGAIQKSPLFIRGSDLPTKKEICQTYDLETLISEKLKKILIEAGVDGVELRQAASVKDGTLLPWWQLMPLIQLPPFSPETKGIVRESPCLVCGRDGFFHDMQNPTEICYNKNVQMLLNSDFYKSYECFGNSLVAPVLNDSHFALPLVLVSLKIMDIFEKNEITGVQFVPVKIMA